LFGETPTAREVAARAAARIGAAFLHDAWIESVDGKLALFEGSGESARTISDELEFAVVATVPAGRYAVAAGDDEAEVEVVATSGRGLDFEELGWEADPRPRAVVVTTEGTRAAGETLAKALGGVVADSNAAGARLVVTLGPPCPAAERRVRLGAGNDVDFAVEGEPTQLAEALARVVDSDAGGGT
jgi:hypothetical protein